eukprot:COSAG05_NODE_21471_length_271_cov_1.209302_1_plen_20_part_01
MGLQNSAAGPMALGPQLALH